MKDTFDKFAPLVVGAVIVAAVLVGIASCF